MIVVDTNVIAYLFLKGDCSENAKELLKNDSEWLVPILWRSEFRNVLSFYMNKNLLSLQNALTIMDEAENMFRGNEYQVNSSKVLELSNKEKHPAYDCEFVALAQELNLKLVTSDKQLIKKFKNIVIPLNKF